MQNQLPKPEDVQVAEEILRRFTEPFGNEAYVRASTLMNAVRGITWRNGVCTEAGALRVWKYIEGKMIEPEFLVEMVNAYVYRLGLSKLKNEVADRMAEAISWASASVGLPPEMKKLSTPTVDVKNALVKSPVLMFLFSLGQCDYQMRLAEVGIEKILSGGKAPKAPTAAPNQLQPGAKA